MIAYGPVTVLKFVLVSGTIVSVAILMGVLVAVMGLFIWFVPSNRYVAGALAILFSLASFITSNLGGFLVGMMLGIVGGAMAFAWTSQAPASAGQDEAERPPTLPAPRRWLPFGRR